MKLRQPPPSKPAFTNDGKELDLQNHEMLRRIMAFKVSENKHENVPQAENDRNSEDEKDKVSDAETQALPSSIFNPQ